jgi:eukaryotic-like serine/threonine-protein kinase
MVGETLSHYRVIRSVGRGGMGEVYEAEDLRLGRHVALKVVSASFKQSPNAYQRLEREARAASSLNHPHICTIYDLFEHDGQPVIVMELLEGRSLAELMRAGTIGPATVLRVAEQLADGLEAAHRAGVIHRDVTPANIFVTTQGDVKILDFGLAKLGAGCDQGDHSDSVTHAADGARLTVLGQVVGTTAYMSPEQVRGDALDARTDLFSCGAVLYEMATGREAFEGRTPPMVCDAILHSTPTPVHRTNGELPTGLQAIIEKALEKDRDLRYQSAADLKADLLRLERGGGSVTSLVSRRPIRWAGVIGTGVLAGLVLVLAIWEWTGPNGGIPIGVLKSVTSSAGVETDPAFSPDGETLAYSLDDGTNADIWLVDSAGGPPPARWTTALSSEQHPSWFPDGRSLAFQSDRNGIPAVWRAPRLGGDTATLVVEDAQTPSVSPDGLQVAFTRRNGGPFLRVAVVDVADPSRVTFLTADGDGMWNHERPAWSPAPGDWISYQATDGIWVVPARGGKARRLNTQAMAATAPAWSSDGRFVYYSLLSSGQFTLWRMPLSGGTAERVTASTEFQRAPSVSADGRLLAFSTERPARHLRFVNTETRAESLAESSSRDDWYPALAPDRHAVYFVSNRWGTAGVWMQRLSGDAPSGDAQLVVSAPAADAASLEVSPSDGRWLVYCLMTGEQREIWVAPTEPGRGSAVRVSEAGVRAIHPTWSPDGHAVAFIVQRDGSGTQGNQQVWMRHVRGGRPDGPAVPVTKSRFSHRWPAWIEPNRIAVVVSEPLDDRGEAAIVDPTGRMPMRRLTTGVDAVRVRWDRARRMLLVSGSWGSIPKQFEVHALAIDGTPLPFAPIPLGRDPLSGFFDLSEDGRLLVTTRVTGSGDLWVLESQDRRRY